MPRRNRNATKIGNRHSRTGGGWMHSKPGKGKRSPDRAPLTPGVMHSKTRLR